MNVLGSSVVNVFTWMAILLVTISIAFWYGTQFSNEKIVFEKISNDVSVIRKIVDDSCQPAFYQVFYNPYTEEGDLNIATHSICITSRDLTHCQSPVCMLPMQETIINLGTVSQIKVTKNETGNIAITGE